MRFGPSAIAEWAAAARPLPALTVSEWAEQCRVLPEASAARGARWRNATAPPLVGIMDSVLEAGVSQVSVQKAAQVGVSECLNNILAFFIAYAPCPMLFVHPSESAAQAYSKERLADMIRTTPALRQVVVDKRVAGPEGRPESTLTLKMFPGGFLALSGAASANSFARWSARLALADDLDRFPIGVRQEGDPLRLLQNRVTTFVDGLCLFVSTPVLKRGRICTLYEGSDQRRYVCRCPACGGWDYFTWNNPSHFRVVFDDRTPATARVECVCGHRVYEPDRRALIAQGQWRPTATALVRGHVGFHLSALSSTFTTLEQLVVRFLTSHQQGPMRLKEFICTSLGEGWEDPHERLDPMDLMARREDF